MATNSRDVKFTLSVETLGVEGIKTLERELRNLAAEGSSAAPEFARLADEVSRISENSATLAAYEKLAEETRQLGDAQTVAATKVETLGARLTELKTATAEASAKQATALANLRSTAAAYDASAAAVKQFKIDNDNAKQAIDAFGNTLSSLTQEQTKAKAALKSANDEYRDLDKVLTKAEGSERKLQSSFDAATDSANKAARAYGGIKSELDAVATEVEQAGLATDDLAASTVQLKTALLAVASEADKASGQLREEAAAVQAAETAHKELLASLNAEIQIRQRNHVAQDQATTDAREQAAALEEAEAAQRAYAQSSFDLVEAAINAQKLTKAERELEEQQRQLVVQAAFEKLANDAKKAVIASRYVRELSDEFDRVQREAEQTTAAIAKTNAAFGTLGLRSPGTIEAEIRGIRESMVTLGTTAGITGGQLNTAFTTGEAKINALERELRALNGTMTIGDKAAGLFANSLGQIAAGNVIADGVGYLINKIKELGVEFFTVNLEAQRLTKALGLVYKSTEVAGTQFDFLKKVANGAGVSVSAISDAFLRFSAAMAGSNINIANTNAVFKEVTRAAGVLGLKAEQVGGILEALGQIASKGTVSLEELRGQLGDRLPGAISIAAKGLGITEDKLISLVESGNLAARVFFPAFEKGLIQTFGTGSEKIEGFIQGWNRLKNAITEVAQQASNSNFFNNLGKGFDLLASNIKPVVTGIELLIERFLILKAIDLVTSFTGIGRAATVTAAQIEVKAAATAVDTAATIANTVATEANTAVKAQNAAAWAAIGTATAGAATGTAAATAAAVGSTAATGAAAVAARGMATAFSLMGSAVRGAMALVGGIPGLFVLVALNAKSLGTSIAEAAFSFTGLSKTMKENEAAIASLAAKEAKRNEQRRQADAEQEQAALRATDALAKATKQAERELETAGKKVKAQEAAIKTTRELIQLTGDTEAGQAKLVRQTIELLGAEEEAKAAREKEIDIERQYVAAIEETGKATGRLTEKQKELVAKTNEGIKTKEQELEKSRQQVQQLELELAQRRVYSESLKDNSGRVKELGDAYENARSKLVVLAASGVASLDQIRAAQINVAASQRIYNQGLLDQESAINRKAVAEQAALGVSRATAEVGVQAANSLAAQARASGDLVLAMSYEVDAKNKQIAIARIDLQIKQSQLKASSDILDAERKEADLLEGKARTARLADIELRRKKLDAQTEEAKSIDEQIKALERERDAMYRNQDARNAGTGTVLSDTLARDANRASIEAQTEALAKQAQRQAENDYKFSKVQSGQGNDAKVKNADTFLDSFGVARNRSDGAPVGTFTNQLPIDQATAAAEKQKKGLIGTGDQALVESALTQANNAYKAIQAMAANSPGAVSPAALQSAQALLNSARAAQDAYNGAVQNATPAATKTAAAAGTGLTQAQVDQNARAAAAAALPNVSSGTPVVITINGKTSTFNAASQSDAAAVAAILQQLETDAVR